jgi:hypothetical protein
VNKTVASVIDDINEWPNPKDGGRPVFFVTAFFTDGEVGSAGRKDMDAALEVQGLLQEAIGQELDFTLEPKKATKSGKAAWKILGFGTPGGAATYTAPGVQGDGAVRQSGLREATPRGRSPEQDGDDPRRSKEEMRRSEALRAAASFLSMSAVGMEKVLEVAEFFEDWLERKTSEPASSAYKGGDPASTVAVQAGAGSEPTSGELSIPDGAGLVDSGEGEAPESTPHIHDYQLRQGVKGFLVCECGKTRKKETV